MVIWWNSIKGSQSVDPLASNVKIGQNYVINGVALVGTYTGADRWSVPSVGNVSRGVHFTDNTVDRVGTRDTVTNVMQELTLELNPAELIMELD